MIAAWLSKRNDIGNLSGILCDMFKEIPGSGWTSHFRGHEIQIGSSEFIKQTTECGVFLSIDGIQYGRFMMYEGPRKGILPMLKRLKDDVTITTFLLSGDDDKHERRKPRLLIKNLMFINNMVNMQGLTSE